MGKKRVAETEKKPDAALAEAPKTKAAKRRLDQGTLYVLASFNNTKVMLADTRGNAIAHTSSGALGFTGAKKGCKGGPTGEDFRPHYIYAYKMTRTTWGSKG